MKSPDASNAPPLSLSAKARRTKEQPISFLISAARRDGVPVVVARAAEAKALLAAVPEGPVRTALEEFADLVAVRAT